jgi:hypothetical protein
MKKFLDQTFKAIKHLFQCLRIRVNKKSGPDSSNVVHVVLEEDREIPDGGLTDFANTCQAYKKEAENRIFERLTRLDQTFDCHSGTSFTVMVNGNRRQVINAVEDCITEFQKIEFKNRSIYVEGITWEKMKY